MAKIESPVVVLVGAGHAHLHIANKAAEYANLGAQLVLIDPGQFWYSGMATGLLGGRYSPEDDQIDAKSLIERGNGRFVRARVESIDTIKKVLSLDTGERLEYDWLSLNIGSEVDMSELGPPEQGPKVWPVKPIPPLYELRKTLERDMQSLGAMPAIAVIGGGATGSELAANLAALGQRNNVVPQVTLISGSRNLLPDAPAGASSRLKEALDAYPVVVRTGARAKEVSERGVVLETGECIECEHVLVAVGLQAKKLTGETGFDGSESGLRVNAFMQSVENSHIFAAGDCADFAPRALPKLGVFGVKAAEVVHKNLLASLRGEPLTTYKPQRVWLAILNLGNGTGLLTWWKLWWHGRLSDWLKNRIDQRFMAQYRARQ